MMTKEEIIKQITRERRHIEGLKRKIEEYQFEIEATEKAIAFWNKTLEGMA